MTEGRIPAFAHDVVPDYLRTKPEPEVEQKMMQLEHKAAGLSNETTQVFFILSLYQKSQNLRYFDLMPQTGNVPSVSLITSWKTASTTGQSLFMCRSLFLETTSSPVLEVEYHTYLLVG